MTEEIAGKFEIPYGALVTDGMSEEEYEAYVDELCDEAVREMSLPGARWRSHKEVWASVIENVFG